MFKYLITILLVLSFFGCGQITEVGNPKKITGTATKGRLAGAEVQIFSLENDGNLGEFLTHTTTDQDGNFELELDFSGPIALLVKGGSYLDEMTGVPVEYKMDTYLMTLLPEATDLKPVSITPMTTMVAARAQRLLTADNNLGLQEALVLANDEVGLLFGLGGVDFAFTIPVDFQFTSTEITSLSPETLSGLILLALSRIVAEGRIPPAGLLELVFNFIEDFSDGRLDNAVDGEALGFDLPISPPETIEALPETILDISPETVDLSPGVAETRALSHR